MALQLVRTTDATAQLAPEEADFDRKALRERADRFAWHQRERYLAALAKLDGGGRDVLAALPALFHYNHAAFPGYTADAPSGLPNYKPDSITTGALKRIAPSANVRSLGRRHNLDAVFLMGSGGSSGHTGDSDIDLWVCCNADLHEALQPKLRAVEGWASSRGVQLQGFLVDARFFADEKDQVHSPMLLDEFYRSGIWLAGREPMWWYVDGASASAYRQTAETLLHYRFVEPDEVIDFGPVGSPSETELRAAATREMSAALSTPYKSLLKLALLESYADAPNSPLLSHRYQQLIVGGESDAHALDTYALLYDHLEDHGGGTLGIDGARDLFVRRILPRARKFRNHAGLLSRFKQWGFDDQQLEAIRHPEKTSLLRCIAEYDKTVSLLRRGAKIAKRLQVDPTPALDHLERRGLRAMDLGLRADVRPNVALVQKKQQWQLQEDGQLVFQAQTYSEVVLWIYMQHFSHANVRYPTAWFERAAKRLTDALQQQDCVLFLNPLPNAVDSPQHLVSAQDDPLSYGGLATNLLRQGLVIRHNKHQATVNNAKNPLEAMAAIRQVALSGDHAIVTAADLDDMRLARRVEEILPQARAFFTEGQSLTLPFGRHRIRLHPATYAASEGVELLA